MSSRGGFFSLNRLLGRKNKNEKNAMNGLTKSSAGTLTRSITNLEEITPQNKITPLAAVHNAPFEQTFRITVYLPLGQLYVARIGAKTKLSELLDMICANKLLDASKFEFRHPTDHTQVFDLSFTVGEVGLNEIKLAQKNGKEDTSVRYRMHNEHRLAARPHTMSSVSPYSSTNSLNSSDSSSIVMNQRMSNGHNPAVPGRKKRVAPRPPSQNSIPEDTVSDPRKDLNVTHESGLKRNNLIRQNFHVSSPNLTVNNNLKMKSYSSNDSSADQSITSNIDDRRSENSFNSNRKPILNRPLSMQLQNTSDDYESKSQTLDSNNSTCSRNHSRTSSEISDITKDGSFPEPQPRPRPIISKKKAPAPPPRTISAIGHNEPVAQPRYALQKLNEEEIKIENTIETVNCKEAPRVESKMESPKPVKNPVNVSKVMLNVNDTEFVAAEAETRRDEFVYTHNIVTNDDCESVTKHTEPSPMQVISSTPENYESTADIDTKPKPKKISVVNFDDSNNKAVCQQIEIDQTDISKQVNEIIDEAVKINEAKLNAENERKNLENVNTFEQFKEINNNDDGICDRMPANDKNGNCVKVASNEIPIRPIFNETRTFDFHEYSDNSLPVSTSSTLNTLETPSTGPESLINSDIEDGYKGNEVENKRMSEITYDDSKEDFIESQFGFLSEHLDTKTHIESDDEKTIASIKRCDIISSTMIADKFSETFAVPAAVEKKDVINELTHIINCNRLETFIKPCNETDGIGDVRKRSSLSNFHIGSYSNGNHEHIHTENNSTTDVSNAFEFAETSNEISNETFDEHNRDGLCNSTEVLDYINHNGSSNAETFVVSKQVSRSVSFHSTANITNHKDNSGTLNVNGNGLSGTPRSTSYISLNGFKSESQYKKEPTTNLIQKSASELSIADTPSLQSIEVMKSILSSSRVMCTKSTPAVVEVVEVPAEPCPVEEPIVQSNQRKPDESKPQNTTTNGPKTWKYQGPPAVNLSTWGERPKSQVHIKSDDDYIFGGNSKIAALQKRFSAQNLENGHSERAAVTPIRKPVDHCDNSCKLPIVRSVEYKKNVNKCSTFEDLPDSGKKLTYEISCIVSEKPFSENVEKSSSCVTVNQGNEQTFSKFIAKPSHMHRMQNGNDQGKLDTTNNISKTNINNVQNKTTNYNKFNSVAAAAAEEKPIFSQFTLRKTGLKEKILDDTKPSDNSSNVNGFTKKTSDELKKNVVPTAPKPPPMPKKPTVRPVSMGAIQSDPRDELLNSIRNFKRNTLKQNCIH